MQRMEKQYQMWRLRKFLWCLASDILCLLPFYALTMLIAFIADEICHMVASWLDKFRMQTVQSYSSVHIDTTSTIYSSIFFPFLFILQSNHFWRQTSCLVYWIALYVSVMSMVPLIFSISKNKKNRSIERGIFFFKYKICIVTALFCGFWNLNWILSILFVFLNKRTCGDEGKETVYVARKNLHCSQQINEIFRSILL